MGKVVAIEAVTLDGVMQGMGRPDEDRRGGFEYGGWAAGRGDVVMQKVLSAHMSDPWSLLLGRITYENFADYWPKQPPNPMSEKMNRVAKFVASTTLTEPLAWQNSSLLSGDAADAVARLKEEHPKTLVIFGSGVLVRSLMRRNLIDEYVLQIHPLVLGTGFRLFPEGSPLTNFALVDSVTTGTGVIIATYRPA
ncbi:MAG TPA: dihydrofolate reductase family protein [Symbiobacteriaceae bacterium]|nr:dihydrofolate reductase family protein [Symbiobacteriaceae bacterium]